VWLAWLERHAHGEVAAIQTPVGNLPVYNDLKALFKSIIDKEYSEELYIKQFSLYIDNIIKRIDLQIGAYGKESNVPQTLFDVLNEQKNGLLAVKSRFGPIATPAELEKLEQR
jgi:phosphoenolpyruvate carboxykinase (GTP)